MEGFLDGSSEVEDLKAGEVDGAGGDEGTAEGEERVDGGEPGEDGGFLGEGPVEGCDLAAVRDVYGAGVVGGDGGGGVAAAEGEEVGLG